VFLSAPEDAVDGFRSPGTRNSTTVTAPSRIQKFEPLHRPDRTKNRIPFWVTVFRMNLEFEYFRGENRIPGHRSGAYRVRNSVGAERRFLDENASPRSTGT
jgi:hypothetical protein